MAEGNESAENKDAHLQSEEQQTGKEEKGSEDLHPRIKQLTEKLHEVETSKDAKIQELTDQLTALSEKIDKRQEKTGDDEYTPEEEAALDRIAKGLIKRKGVLTQDDLKEEKQAQQYERLSEKHDGSDGYPKFIPADVQAFAKRRGISNLEDAYFIMNRTAIDQVTARKLSKTPEAPESEKATGKEQGEPGKKTLTPEDIANMSDEEYEIHRTAILGSIKPQRTLEE